MKVFMEPSLTATASSEGGINTIIRAYHQYADSAGITFVDILNKADVHAIHAGAMSCFNPNIPVVNHLHGLYWTGDYKAGGDEYAMNAAVINVMRGATVLTVPSAWVAKPIRQNLRINPIILPHGFDPEKWYYVTKKQNYVYWNKNRVGDVCDPKWVNLLASALKSVSFVSTYGETAINVNVVGVQPYEKNQMFVQQAQVYLSTSKETFGIGVLEALVSGTPVLGFAEGGNLDLVEHKVTGYLATPNDLPDLIAGYNWIISNYQTLQFNLAQEGHYAKYHWENVVSQLASVYHTALDKFVLPTHRKVSVVIPAYNKAATLKETIQSVLNQQPPVHEIIVVDNNSADNTKELVAELPVTYINEPKQGVAHARNTGCFLATGEYIVCLDGDDQIQPEFVSVTRRELDNNPTIGVAYTGLQTMSHDGKMGRLSQFPSHYNFDQFLLGSNQIPTCAMFRKELWERVGGYRQRFAPLGAGAEDAEFWFRLGLYGYYGKKVDPRGLFLYREGGSTSKPGYNEADWRSIHAWQSSKETLPFAAVSHPDLGSNKVYQSDTPKVSVIIPCTQKHCTEVWNALDSVDYQTLRQTETIVVFNGVTKTIFADPEIIRLRKAYPHVTFLFYEKSGAGYARNQGGKIAIAPLLLFLDADDWLEPAALEKMVSKYVETGAIVYGNYYGWATLDSNGQEKMSQEGRLLNCDRNGYSKIVFKAADYDVDLANQQPKLLPNGQFYIWSLISSLVPRAYWQCVGGFDEGMVSWEDWDFWIRLAHEKLPFVKIEDFVLNYGFNTGSLREKGKVNHSSLIDHMQSKYKEYMSCCGGKNRRSSVQPVSNTNMSLLPQITARAMKAGVTLVKVRYISGNIGDQPVSIRGVSYGSHVHGDVFYMAEEHAKMFPKLFQIVTETVSTQSVVDAPIAQPTELDTVGLLTPEITKNDSQQNIMTAYTQEIAEVFGLSLKQRKAMRELGVITFGDLMKKRDAVAKLPMFKEERKRELFALLTKLTTNTS